MSALSESILTRLQEAIIDTSKQKTTPYDTTGTVTRVEEGTAWVHIPGGVDETPVRMTVNAKKGDSVQVRVSGGKAFLVGNGTAPPTDDTRAIIADENAMIAGQAAAQAIDDASRAQEAADSAEQSAQSAQISANNANQYASRALGGLSTVQSVVETLTWITQHGTMTLTTDTELDPTHVYFVLDANGDYVVGGTHYAIVSEPNADDLGSYYVLSIDESLQNYVGTHLALTGEGLWLLPETNGYKVLIATGAGQYYNTAGTYIIDDGGAVVAYFGSNGMTVEHAGTLIANLGYGLGNASSGTATAPFYTLGMRKNGSDIGNYSTAEGYNATASAYGSHAEGDDATASGFASHAEGSSTTSSGSSSHSEGSHTSAVAYYSHAEGYYSRTTVGARAAHAGGWETIANEEAQTVIGKYNVADTSQSFIVGGGSSDTARKNIFTVDWNGKPSCYDWAGNEMRSPVTSSNTDGKRVAAMVADSATNMVVVGQWGTTGTTYSNKNITVSSSDIRLKKNVEDSKVNALDTINKIRVREFDWLHTREHQKIGFIADELEQLDPKLSVGGGYEKDGMMNVKSVDTFYLIGYLVKAVQELSAEVERLKGGD